MNRMTNKEFARRLEERTKRFALAIISISSSLPNTIEGRAIRIQLIKSGTSIGANYFEANRARSKADFRNKIKICEGEANETIYWLTIVNNMKWSDSNSINNSFGEAKDLLAIFTSISKNTKL